MRGQFPRVRGQRASFVSKTSRKTKGRNCAQLFAIANVSAHDGAQLCIIAHVCTDYVRCAIAACAFALACGEGTGEGQNGAELGGNRGTGAGGRGTGGRGKGTEGTGGQGDRGQGRGTGGQGDRGQEWTGETHKNTRCGFK